MSIVALDKVTLVGDQHNKAEVLVGLGHFLGHRARDDAAARQWRGVFAVCDQVGRQLG